MLWEQALPVIGDSILQLPEGTQLNYLYASSGELYGLELRPVYEAYREELLRLTPQEWVTILEDPDSYKSDVLAFDMEQNGNYLYATLPVTDRFPKTQRLLDALERNYDSETYGTGAETEPETEGTGTESEVAEAGTEPETAAGTG